MTTIEEVARQPLAQRLARIERTPDDLAAAIRGRSEAALSRRPDAKNWAAKEILCHLRDTEELYAVRAQTMLVMEDPTFLRADPDRWAAERQYLRNDAAEALAAFRVRRQESLDFFKKLSPADLQRSCTHPAYGRITIDQIVGLLAWHDDNHLDQLKRALDGKA
ncbi:MAG: DinB family protein [Candidatus Rokubacteria bacterium]|nr:DinB family protein [Candidatus Rokubacteria bacterium]